MGDYPTSGKLMSRIRWYQAGVMPLFSVTHFVLLRPWAAAYIAVAVILEDDLLCQSNPL
jgi:hypothetical protein